MKFIDNRLWLSKRYRSVAETVAKYSEVLSSDVFKIEEAKSGDATLKLITDGKEKYVYSKYNPKRDGQRLLKNYQIDNSAPVLFIGAGLGYQVEQFIEQYPFAKYAIYEPNPSMLVEYVKATDFSKYNANNLLNFWSSEDDLKFNLEVLLTKSRKKLQVIILPGYEELYHEQITYIQQRVIEVMKDEKDSLAVDISFQQRWTLNAIKNFPYVATTPNIFTEKIQEKFKGKPAIIVAAGPSLNREIEHLREIKEQGTAYLFSVGSAINTLIKENIYPDAVLSYDPQAHNYRVVEIIKEQGITSIPLIFGSSVGFETVERYEGPLLHTLISQDTVAPNLLEVRNMGVNDAPSIAIVTYQILSKLQCNPIILVGQNLGFYDQQYYAKGISYEKRPTELTESDQSETLYVKDVFGNDIQTNSGFNSMREQLEMYIQATPQIKTINTTYGGAKIEGAIFEELPFVKQHYLKHRVVEKDWYSVKQTLNYETLNTNIEKLNISCADLNKQYMNAFQVLEQIFDKVKYEKMLGIEQLYGVFDQQVDKVLNNSFYQTFIEPMIRVQFKQMMEVTQSVRYEDDALVKGKVLVTAFEKYFQTLHQYYQYTVELYEEMVQRLTEEQSEEDEQ